MLPFLVALAFAEPCPPPPLIASAALTPDGGAHVLTHGTTTACWWTIDEHGDATVARHFDLQKSRPERITWDESRQSLCIDVIDADGTRRQRVFPQGAR